LNINKTYIDPRLIRNCKYEIEIVNNNYIDYIIVLTNDLFYDIKPYLVFTMSHINDFQFYPKNTINKKINIFVSEEVPREIRAFFAELELKRNKIFEAKFESRLKPKTLANTLKRNITNRVPLGLREDLIIFLLSYYDKLLDRKMIKQNRLFTTIICNAIDELHRQKDDLHCNLQSLKISKFKNIQYDYRPDWMNPKINPIRTLTLNGNVVDYTEIPSCEWPDKILLASCFDGKNGTRHWAVSSEAGEFQGLVLSFEVELESIRDEANRFSKALKKILHTTNNKELKSKNKTYLKSILNNMKNYYSNLPYYNINNVNMEIDHAIMSLDNI